MRSDFRVLLCGMGSTGERHARNLIGLGVTEIAVLRRPGSAGYRTLDREFPTFHSLEEALAGHRPALTIVCNPTSLHMSHALAAAKAGSNLLIEKPLGDDLSGIEELQGALAGRGLKAMVAYMQRFHPLNRLLQGWLAEGERGPLGRPVYYHCDRGEYLPDWHPWEDYRHSYAARRDLGGGPALTFSHEYDILVWLFGKPARCVAMAGSASELKLRCEHSVDSLFEYPGGLVAHVHLDYFQRPARHRCVLVGTRGRATVDYHAGELILERNPGGDGITDREQGRPAPEVHRVPAGFERNDMFKEELGYLLACIEKGEDPRPSIGEARESLRMALWSLQGRSDG